jgi:hypothetical protein
MIYSFLSHSTPGKCRIYALPDQRSQHLLAVTTLGSDHSELTDELVATLNTYLAERDEDELTTVLNRTPQAVRTAIRRFLRDNCVNEPGRFNSWGPLDVIREAVYFCDPNEVQEYIEAAYTIGLGIRMDNRLDSEGEIEWVVQLMSDEAFVPAGRPPRTWALPDEIRLLHTWTSQENNNRHVVTAAMDVARAANVSGQWCRLHTVLHGDGDTEFDSATSEFVVEVFDTPPPYDTQGNDAEVVTV